MNLITLSQHRRTALPGSPGALRAALTEQASLAHGEVDLLELPAAVSLISEPEETAEAMYILSGTAALRWPEQSILAPGDACYLPAGTSVTVENLMSPVVQILRFRTGTAHANCGGRARTPTVVRGADVSDPPHDRRSSTDWLVDDARIPSTSLMVGSYLARPGDEFEVDQATLECHRHSEADEMNLVQVGGGICRTSEGAVDVHEGQVVLIRAGELAPVPSSARVPHGRRRLPPRFAWLDRLKARRTMRPRGDTSVRLTRRRDLIAKSARS